MDVFDSNWKAKEDTMLDFSVDKKNCTSIVIQLQSITWTS